MKKLLPKVAPAQPSVLPSLFSFDDNDIVEQEPVIIEPAPVVAVTIKPAAALPAHVEKNATKVVHDIFKEEGFVNLYDAIKTAAASGDGKTIFSLARVPYIVFDNPFEWDRITKQSYRRGYGFIDKSHLGAAINVDAVQLKYKQNYDNNERYEFRLNIIYVSQYDGTAALIPVDFHYNTLNNHYNNVSVSQDAHYKITTITVRKPTLPSRIYSNIFFAQTKEEIRGIISQKKPWLEAWLDANPSYNIFAAVAFPWLETLIKAGYGYLAEKFITWDLDFYRLPADVEDFNRLCGSGTKPKDIFKCSKTLFTTLKDQQISLDTWDALRRLEKKELQTADAINIIIQMQWTVKELDFVNSILCRRHNDRPIFTLQTLTNYLNRLDMFEALTSRESLPILKDYLYMCEQLNMQPRIDGDSLKREHDICARLVRERRNEILANEMKEQQERDRKAIEEGNAKLSRAEYKESVYFIRAINDYDDLLDEAKQQHNCVASYAGRIASGQSRIFTMRETAHPERSLVTIELSPDCKLIRQKLLAYNRPIHNKSISDFIDRWHKQLNAA